MSKDGFKACVSIEEAEICSGKYNSNSYNIASMTLIGVVLEISDIKYNISTPQQVKETYIQIYIDFRTDTDFHSDVPVELSGKCIGDISIIPNEEINEKSDCEYIRAHCRIFLNDEAYHKLISLKDSKIIFEPIFYRENEKKITKKSKHDGVINYIERVYFSPYIESDVFNIHAEKNGSENFTDKTLENASKRGGIDKDFFGSALIALQSVYQNGLLPIKSKYADESRYTLQQGLKAACHTR